MKYILVAALTVFAFIFLFVNLGNESCVGGSTQIVFISGIKILFGLLLAPAQVSGLEGGCALKALYIPYDLILIIVGIVAYSVYNSKRKK